MSTHLLKLVGATYPEMNSKKKTQYTLRSGNVKQKCMQKSVQQWKKKVGSDILINTPKITF